MIEMEASAQLNLKSLDRALALGDDTRASAEQGESEMSRLIAAMQEMSASSRQISQITKTIEEIAFQTNLLALNAAVEAARAGESGAGFAVVADEVRTLARKSAESANSTRARIDEAIRRVDAGEEISRAVEQRLKEVLRVSNELRSELGEIAAASQQQCRSVEHVSTAITDIDKVTQKNAANSEEMASTAEQLQDASGEMFEKTQCLERLCGQNRTAKAANPFSSSNGPAKGRQSRGRAPELTVASN